MKMRSVLVVLLGFLCVSYAGIVWAEGEDLLSQGIREYKGENYEEALATLTQAEGTGTNGTVSYYLGMTYKRMGDHRTALRYLTEAQQLGTNEAGLYREIADCNLALDDYAAARTALSDGEKAGAPQGELDYTRGLLLMREKNYDGALAAFTKAGEEEPKLAGMAQFQTAMVLAAQQKPQQARSVLQSLIAADYDTEVTAYARDYERQFAAALEEHRTWRGTLQAAYMYDSNAIGEPQNTAGLPTLPTAHDGALVANLRLDYQPLLDGNLLFSGRYTVNSVTYENLNSNNQITQSLTLTPGFGKGTTSFSLPLFYNHTFIDSEQYLHSFGARPTLSLRLGKAHIAQLLGSYTKRMMLFDYINQATERTESRDSDIFMAGAGYVFLFAEGQGMANLRYEWSHDDTDGTNWRNTGNRVAASALIPIKPDLSANIGGSAFYQNYDGINNYFSTARKDVIYTAATGLGWELNPMTKLTLQFNLTRADSNVAVYDYVRRTVTAGVELTF